MAHCCPWQLGCSWEKRHKGRQHYSTVPQCAIAILVFGNDSRYLLHLHRWDMDKGLLLYVLILVRSCSSLILSMGKIKHDKLTMDIFVSRQNAKDKACRNTGWSSV